MGNLISFISYFLTYMNNKCFIRSFLFFNCNAHRHLNLNTNTNITYLSLVMLLKVYSVVYFLLFVASSNSYESLTSTLLELNMLTNNN